MGGIRRGARCLAYDGYYQRFELIFFRKSEFNYHVTTFSSSLAECFHLWIIPISSAIFPLDFLGTAVHPIRHWQICFFSFTFFPFSFWKRSRWEYKKSCFSDIRYLICKSMYEKFSFSDMRYLIVLQVSMSSSITYRVEVCHSPKVVGKFIRLECPSHWTEPQLQNSNNVMIALDSSNYSNY